MTTKHILTILGSGLLTLSPMFSLVAFMLYGGVDPTVDAVCFIAFGLTCYALAHLQCFMKRN